jgi:hypothetical protein
MYWYVRTLSRLEIGSILLAIALLGALACFFIAFPNFGRRTNDGFGPEWDCTNPGDGGAICVKNLPTQRRSAVRSEPTTGPAQAKQ